MVDAWNKGVKKEEHRSRTNTPTLSSAIVSPEKEEEKHTKQRPPPQHTQPNQPRNAWNFEHFFSSSSSTFTSLSALNRQLDTAGKETKCLVCLLCRRLQGNAVRMCVLALYVMNFQYLEEEEDMIDEDMIDA